LMRIAEKEGDVGVLNREKEIVKELLADAEQRKYAEQLGIYEELEKL